MLRSRRRRPASGRQVQCRLAYCSASRREAHSCMSLILPSRNVITTGLLSVGTPSAPIQCAEPMTLSSAIWVSERWLIFQPPLVFKTSRASFRPPSRGCVFPPEVAARDAAPLSVLCKERGERLGIALTQRLSCGAKLIDHGRKYDSGRRGRRLAR